MQSSLIHNAFECGFTRMCTVLISAHSIPAQLGRLGMSIALTNSVGRLASLFLRRLHVFAFPAGVAVNMHQTKTLGHLQLADRLSPLLRSRHIRRDRGLHRPRLVCQTCRTFSLGVPQ